MDAADIDSILEKYGTNGISAVLRILRAGDEEFAFKTSRQLATSEMADDLENALVEYKKHM